MTTIENAVPRQMLAITADQGAIAGFESQATGLMCRRRRRLLMAPNGASLNSICQTMPPAMPGTTQATSAVVRRSVVPSRPRVSPRMTMSARIRPKICCPTMLPPTKMSVASKTPGSRDEPIVFAMEAKV